MKSVNCTKPGYTSITCSKIEHIPYNVIFTTKRNISSILITNISLGYLNLSLVNEYVGNITIPTQVIKYYQYFYRQISQSDCSIYTTDFYASDNFVVYLSGLVLRRKNNTRTLSAQFSNSGEIITY
jgi:hypothetical protein